MKSLTCRDAGFDCAAVIKGDTEDEIMQKAGEHARSEHNIKPEDMTPEFQQKIRGLILYCLDITLCYVFGSLTSV